MEVRETHRFMHIIDKPQDHGSMAGFRRISEKADTDTPKHLNVRPGIKPLSGDAVSCDEMITSEAFVPSDAGSMGAIAIEEECNEVEVKDEKLLTFVYLAFFLVQVFVNYDCGAIPCTLSSMAEEFHLSPTWQGLLGALSYIGLTIAAPCCGGLLNSKHTKRILVATLLLNALCTLALTTTSMLPNSRFISHKDLLNDITQTSTASPPAEGFFALAKQAVANVQNFFISPLYAFGDLTPSSSLLLISRFCIGLTQAPFVVFTPVWVDDFAPSKKAALWMGIMQGAAVVGVTTGYIFAGLLTIYMGLNWRYAICIQATVLFLLVIFIAIMPSDMINVSSKAQKKPATFVNDIEMAARVSPEADPRYEDIVLSPNVSRKSSTKNNYSKVNVNDNGNQSSAIAATAVNRNSSYYNPVVPRNRPHVGGCATCTHLFSTPLYVFPMLELCALFFVVTGIQFWGTLFLNARQINPQTTMIIFAIVASTAPTAGVIGGGMVIDALGGYRTSRGRLTTLYTCALDSFLAFLCAITGAFTENTIVFVIALWLLLCFGGALLPPLTGIQMDTVKPDARPLASGISMFMYNIWGYSLGAFLPGLAIDVFHGDDLFAMRLVLLWSSIAWVLSLCSAIYARRSHIQHLHRSIAELPDAQVGHAIQVDNSKGVLGRRSSLSIE